MANHLVVPDTHSKPGTSNARAEWLGKLILDLKPTAVVFLGDVCDFESLCSYDRGTKTFQGRSYQSDIVAHLDFMERVWSTVRSAKKKLPRRVVLHGNHEHRVTRAVNLQPELEGTISLDDLRLNDFFDTIIPYEGSTPGVFELDGIHYAHYLVSGVSGRAISGEHLAHSLLAKQYTTCVVGHNHTLDYCQRSRVDGQRIQALCAGCYVDHKAEFAGEAQKLWWPGVCYLRNVNQGTFDLQCISLQSIKKEYSRRGGR